MCTEKDNEELIEALVKAARAAFLSLKETTKEHFYFYALIFDDGPNVDYTEELLAGLKERGVNATFFCWEKKWKSIPILWKKYMQTGI